jgi:hypothetical protein
VFKSPHQRLKALKLLDFSMLSFFCLLDSDENIMKNFCYGFALKLANLDWNSFFRFLRFANNLLIAD